MPLTKYSVLNLRDAADFRRPLLRSLLTRLRLEGAVLFLGAGFSQPAGAWTFQQLRVQLAAAVDQVLRERYQASSRVRAEVLATFQDESLLFEHILEHLHRVLGQRAISWINVLDVYRTRMPTRHRYLSHLAAMGCVTGIVTPNFDTLIEQSLIAKRIAFSVFCPHTGQSVDVQGINGYVRIIKPHGSFELPSDSPAGHSLIATTSGIGYAPDPVTRAVIMNMVEGKPIVFAGYRNQDIDLFPIFIDDANRLGQVIWIAHNEADPPQVGDAVDKLLNRRVTSFPSIAIRGNIDGILREWVGKANDDQPSPEEPPAQIDFRVLLEDEDGVVLATANLLQQYGRRDAAVQIYRLLVNHLSRKKRPRIVATAYEGLSHAMHTYGNSPESLGAAQRACAIRRRYLPAKDAGLSRAIQWLSYEHWGRVKRELASLIICRRASFTRVVRHFVIGRRWLIEAQRVSEKTHDETRRWINWRVAWQRLDLIHFLLDGVSFICGNGLRRFYQLLVYAYDDLRRKHSIADQIRFRSLLARWHKALSWDPDIDRGAHPILDVPPGYYWFRELEAHLRANMLTQSEAILALECIEQQKAMWRGAGEDLTRANCYAYDALIRAWLKPISHDECKAALQEAVDLFTQSGARTGQYRVWLFRKMLGLEPGPPLAR